MRALRLAAAFIAVLLSPQIAPPAGASPSSNFSLSSPSAQAGSPEIFTITRLSGGSGVYVLFQTADGTAHAGTDYLATKQLLYFKGGQTTATVSVPTFVDQSATKLSFKAAIAASSIAVTALGTILEPTQTCADGSIIPLASACPSPAPAPTPASNCPTITDPAWQNGGPISFASTICKATKACDSLWRNAATDAAGITLPKTIIGIQYYVNPMINGLMPAGYAGGAVNAVPIGGAGTQQMEGDWQFDQSCFG